LEEKPGPSNNGVTVIADLWGPDLRALAGGIDFLKISHLELIKSGYCADDSRSSILQALVDLRVTGARNIVVSCAEAPALSLLDGQPFEIVSPKFQPLDFHGTGDSMFNQFKGLLLAEPMLPGAVCQVNRARSARIHLDMSNCEVLKYG
jgi:1-phosphofructokinase